MKRIQERNKKFAEAKAAELQGLSVLPDIVNSRGMDGERFRKLQGLDPSQKLFVVTGIYPDVRDALLQRGWKQIKDEESSHFDLKFALKNSEIPYGALQPHQQANHFKGANSITTKAGLIKAVRGTHLFVAADHSCFFPRAYDLGDAADYADFVDEFRSIEAEKVVRTIVVAGLNKALEAGALTVDALEKASSVAPAASFRASADRVRPTASELIERLLGGPGETLRRQLLQQPLMRAILASSPGAAIMVNAGVANTALSVCDKRCKEWSDEDLDTAPLPLPASAAANAAFTADETPSAFVTAIDPSVSPAEWEVLRYCSVFREGGPVEQAPVTRKAEEDAKALERDMNIKRDKLIKKLKKLAKRNAANSKATGGVAAGSLSQALAQALAKSSLTAVLEGKVKADDEEIDALRDAAGPAGSSAEGEDDDDDDEENEDDDNQDDEDDDDADDDSDKEKDGGSDENAPANGRKSVGAGKQPAGFVKKGAGAGGGGGAGAAAARARATNSAAGGGKQSFAFGHSVAAPLPPPGTANKGPENSDDFNNGTGKVSAGSRDRGAVAAMQLKVWRERLIKEGNAAAAADIYSDSLGDPVPTVSSAANRVFAALVPLSAEVWSRCVAAIARINDTPACQTSLNACPPKNIWIIKPAGKSRGRGIECERSLSALLNNRGGGDGAHNETQWVVQKYIERPLLVHGFKWDIRQWVLVTSWNPLTVWCYDRCYLRFCTYPFELDNLSNRYIHLSNNSVQKNSVAFDNAAIEGGMWHMNKFAAWLQEQNQKGAWEGLTYLPDPGAQRGDCNVPPPQDQGEATSSSPSVASQLQPVSSCQDIWGSILHPKLKRIISASLQAAQERLQPRQRSFEIYGYDFMVDARLNPWLIEINASPDFSYSTLVTEELVKAASEDTVKTVVDYREWEEAVDAAKKSAKKEGTGSSGVAAAVAALGPAPGTGGWRCIFKSQAPLKSTMTCTAHGIFCAGTAIKPPSSASSSVTANNNNNNYGGSGTIISARGINVNSGAALTSASSARANPSVSASAASSLAGKPPRGRNVVAVAPPPVAPPTAASRSVRASSGSAGGSRATAPSSTASAAAAAAIGATSVATTAAAMQAASNRRAVQLAKGEAMFGLPDTAVAAPVDVAAASAPASNRSRSTSRGATTRAPTTGSAGLSRR